MTDQANRAVNHAEKEVRNNQALEPQVSRDRRSLLKGAAGTLPIILTLQSGAALARTSNLIKSAPQASAIDEQNRVLCLDKSSVWKDFSKNKSPDTVYDLGEPPEGLVQAINEGVFYSYDELSGTMVEVSRYDLCEGGVFFRQDALGEMQPVTVNHGMLVSSTALSSFAGKIDIIDI